MHKQTGILSHNCQLSTEYNGIISILLYAKPIIDKHIQMNHNSEFVINNKAYNFECIINMGNKPKLINLQVVYQLYLKWLLFLILKLEYSSSDY